MTVTLTEVQELLEGRGFRPGEEEMAPTVFTVVLERLMDQRGVDNFDDLYARLSESGYVLGLDDEETRAFAWAHLWGTE